MNNIIVSHQDAFGALWSIGWLFTIGYLRLKFWKGVLALFIWPYFIGVKFGKHHEHHVNHVHEEHHEPTAQ